VLWSQLAHARPQQLNTTLASLVSVRGIDRQQIFVLQDGNDKRVREVVHAAGLRLVRLPGSQKEAPTAENDKTGGTIARAYHEALTHTFDVLTSDEAIIVVEDDLLFSPDLMEFFLAGYHVLRADKTLWCVSAWNDNGFRGLVAEERPMPIRRTNYFPGLGWLLTRRLYKRELEPGWPREHWDHWMRSETVHRTSKGRECLYPVVPRTFHHGARGTFMSPLLHARFFAHVAYSTDPDIHWPTKDWPALRASLSAEGYERRMRALLAAARPISDLRDLLDHVAADATARRGKRAHGGTGSRDHGESHQAEAGGNGSSSGSDTERGGMPGGTPSAIVSVWYTQPPRSTSTAVFRELAIFLGLWHEIRRAQHNGVHEIWCGSRYVLLVNTLHGADNPPKPSPYADLAPASRRIFTTGEGVIDAVRRASKAYPGRSQTSVCRDLSRPNGPHARAG
jgi:hypothetical protein